MLAVAASSQATPCPAGSFQISSVLLGGIWDEAVLDTTVSFGHVEYDLVDGTLGIVHPGSLSPTSVVARDLFDVTGIAPGTKVTVTVTLDAQGTISTPGCGGSGCGGTLEASIDVGGGHAVEQAPRTVFAAGSVPVAVTPSLSIVIVAGMPLLVELGMRGMRAPGGNHTVAATAVYRFTGLPPGAGLVSCRGYVGAPTPAAPVTWGRLKAAYR